jgi:hypothetical protein
MQYHLLEAASCRILEEMVVESLHQGWTPLVGVAACVQDGAPPMYLQAMVRENGYTAVLEKLMGPSYASA